MTATKNDILIFLLGWTDFWWGGKGGMSTFLAGGGIPPIPPVGKTLYIYIYIYIYIYMHYIYIYMHIYIYYTYAWIKELCQQVFIDNEEAPCTSHTFAKWPPYFWALCVSQIYMVYIFTCLFSVRNKINLSCHV